MGTLKWVIPEVYHRCDAKSVVGYAKFLGLIPEKAVSYSETLKKNNVGELTLYVKWSIMK